MEAFTTSRLEHRAATRARYVKPLAAIGLVSLFASAAPARAADGCLVLLCLAAPSWSSIAQCVEPVRQVLNDLAHGRPFPSCPMSGSTNSANNQWASAPGFCPPQYVSSQERESGTIYSCAYSGAITVNVNGALWSRTWWSLDGGNTVTEFTAAAKSQLGSWDTRFDDDYAAWLSSLPPPQTSCLSC